jgi:hypothetical protein
MIELGLSLVMNNQTPTLAEWPYRMVRLAYDLCPRRGEYRKDTFCADISQEGGHVRINTSPPNRAISDLEEVHSCWIS